MKEEFVLLGPDPNLLRTEWVVRRTAKDEEAKAPTVAACPTREAAEAARRLLSS